jgi:hypothetical protein
MKNTNAPQVGAPKLQQLDDEFLERQKHFIAQATASPELKQFFANPQDYDVREALPSTPGFINLVLKNLQDKQQDKHSQLLDEISKILSQQDLSSNETLEQLAKDFVARNEKIRIEVLQQVYRRANSAAVATVKMLLKNGESKHSLSLAILTPQLYGILLEKKPEFIIDTERYLSFYLFLVFAVKVKQVLLQQATSTQEQFDLKRVIQELNTQKNQLIPESVLNAVLNSKEESQKIDSPTLKRKASIFGRLNPFGKSVESSPTEKSPSDSPSSLQRSRSTSIGIFTELSTPKNKEESSKKTQSPVSPQSRMRGLSFNVKDLSNAKKQLKSMNQNKTDSPTPGL